MTILWMLVGCLNLPSSSVDTNNLTVEYEAIQEGNQLNLQGLLRLSSQPSTFIVLSDGDQLTCEYNGISYPLENIDELSAVEYTANITITDNTPFISCSLLRTNGLESRSIVELPDELQINFPTSVSSLTQEDTLRFTWTPEDNDDTLKITLNSACFFEEEYIVEFSKGEFELPIDELNFFDPESNACHATVIIDRSRSGELSTDFASGHIQGIRRMRSSILLRP